MSERHPDPLPKEFAGDLLQQVAADRAVLERLAEHLGTGSQPVKELTVWLGEKAARAKLWDARNDDLSTFQGLEFLSLGVLSKAALWDALKVTGEVEDHLRGYDFERLAKSAQAQHAEVEQRRLAWARRALHRPQRKSRSGRRQ